MPMEELSRGEVIFNVKEGVEIGEESAKDMSAILEELILMVRVGEKNRF